MVYDLKLKGNSIVLFLDIIGFSNFIESNKNINYNEPPQTVIVDTMPGFYNRITNLCISKQTISERKQRFTWISDSIIVSTNKRNIENLLQTLEELHYYFLSGHFVLRGAITCGYHYDNKNIWGPALCEAVKLEKETAKYPRVIINNEIMNLLRINNYDQYIFRESNNKGYFYFDYFNTIITKNLKQQNKVFYLIDQYALTIIEESKKCNKAEQLIKWQWLANELIRIIKEHESDIQKEINTKGIYSTVMSKVIDDISILCNELYPLTFQSFY